MNRTRWMRRTHYVNAKELYVIPAVLLRLATEGLD